MTSPGTDKNFYGKDFSISFTLYRKGGVFGTLSHYSNKLEFRKTFTGLYSIEDQKIKLGFIIDWNDPNLTSRTHTAFTGTIFNYDEVSECLILRWLKLDEPEQQPCTSIERNFEVMFDCSEKDPYLETKKMLQRIPSDIF